MGVDLQAFELLPVIAALFPTGGPRAMDVVNSHPVLIHHRIGCGKKATSEKSLNQRFPTGTT